MKLIDFLLHCYVFSTFRPFFEVAIFDLLCFVSLSAFGRICAFIAPRKILLRSYNLDYFSWCCLLLRHSLAYTVDGI